MQLVIVAGGKGTRLKEVLGDRPKPMAEVGGKPLVEHQILLARKYGIRKILILAGYGAEYIQRYFGDGSNWDADIHYSHEPEPLGTAGALRNARDKLEDTFVVMYGDTLMNVDLQRFVSHHTPGTAVTLLVHPNDHPQDSDLVEMDEENRIVAFHSYPHARDANLGNLVNAALYVFSTDCLDARAGQRADIAKDLFPALLRDGKTLRGYRSREYIKDAGTPERLEKVRRDYESKVVEAAVLDRPMRAVFMDRDGTLNYDHGWLRSAGNLELLPDVEEAVRAVNQSGRLAVLVTNQPVVARGECTEEDLRRIHNRLEWLLGQKGAYLDGIYYCPHHPDAGYPGERLDLKVACSCRKPETGMMEAAARELNVDIERSWMIGDREADIEAAARFGIGSVLVETNQEHFQEPRGAAPTARARTLREAVDLVLKA